MSLLTPSGRSNYDWTSLGEKFTKTASTGSQLSSREKMYEIAAKFLKKAQFEDESSDFGVNSVSETEPAPASDDVGLDSLDKAPFEKAPAEVSEKKPSAGGDAVSAVQDLVSKVEKAEEITQKVQDALSKVDDAVKDVKDAVGVVGEEGKEGEVGKDEVDEIEIEITDDEVSDDADEEIKDISDEVEVEVTDDSEEKVEDSDKLVKESKDSKEDCDKSKEKCASKEVGDFVKLSSINNNTRKQIKEYWEKLGMPKDFVALMVKDYEK